MSRRVLLLSDTHGHVHPSILELAGQVDRVVHAGDVGSADVLRALQKAAGSVHAVIGNNDVRAKWPSQDHPALDDLPARLRVELPGGVVAVEHGHRANPVARRHAILRERHSDARLILYGHSHRFVIDDGESPWVVNPGAAGRSRTFGGPSCVMLSIARGGWRLEPFRFSL